MDQAERAALMEREHLVPATEEDLASPVNRFTSPFIIEQEETQRKIVAAIRGGATMKQACSIAGITRATFNRYAKLAEQGEQPWADIWDRFYKAVDEGVMRKLAVIDRAAEEGNWTAAAWWLERNFPEQYALRNRTELTGKDGEPIKITLEWPD